MTRNPKRFYLLCIFCLIPFFGFIFGLVLLYFSVFRLKNVRLSLFILISMVCGIGITIWDQNQLHNEYRFGTTNNPFFKEMVQTDFISIKILLDTYKNDNGHYPDSLKRLKILNPGISIDDPFIYRRQEPNIFEGYHYSIKDTSYLLFSVGVDGIPGTKDDIFPTKKIAEPERNPLLDSSRKITY